MIEDNIFSLGTKKLLTFKSHIETWLDSEAPTPIALEIHPTERCNQHCPACQAQYSLKLSDVRRRAKNGVDLNLTLLDTVWDKKPSGIILSGNTGDPLMHPEISTLLDLLREKRIPTVIITNGQNLNKTLSEQIIKTCQGVRISLDAHDADLYTQTHGVKSDIWQMVLRNIQELVSLRNALGLNEENCTIGIGYLTGNKTAYGMVPATKLAREIGVDHIQFRPFHYSDMNVEKELKMCEQFETQNFRVFSSYQKYSRVSAPARSYVTCHGAWFYTLIDARGDIYLCCHHVGNPNAFIGSLRDTSWSQLIASDARRSKINSFNTSGCLPLCRLDSQNRLLESIQSSKVIPLASLDSLSAKHAPFL